MKIKLKFLILFSLITFTVCAGPYEEEQARKKVVDDYIQSVQNQRNENNRAEIERFRQNAPVNPVHCFFVFSGIAILLVFCFAANNKQ